MKIYALLIVVVFSSFLYSTPFAGAAEPHQRVFDPPQPGPRPHVVVPARPPGVIAVPVHRPMRYRRPPVGAFSFYIGGIPYFYHSGVYYRHRHGEYILVRAPIGARIRILPDGCSTLVVRGLDYYVCDDDYYVRDGDDYVVIGKPADIDPDPEVTVGDEVRVRVDVLNVRSGPGKNHDIIYKLQGGDIVTVRGRNPDWYFVGLPNGAEGWVMSRHVKLHRARPEGKG